MSVCIFFSFFFFFNDTATTEIYTLSLHDALPISRPGCRLLRPRRADLVDRGAGLVAGLPGRGDDPGPPGPPGHRLSSTGPLGGGPRPSVTGSAVIAGTAATGESPAGSATRSRRRRRSRRLCAAPPRRRPGGGS